MAEHYNDNVFINCPFDSEYRSLFDAIVFTVYDSGFRARCALEVDDSSEVRILKIFNIIADCRYGIHDISRTELSQNTGLPRFNMPLELGMFLSAKKFGDNIQKKKTCLILDREQFRYQTFISDIAGQDIRAHNDNVDTVITVVRNWLRNASKRTTIPGGNIIGGRYNTFLEDLPQLCNELQLDVDSLIFNDYSLLVSEWL